MLEDVDWPIIDEMFALDLETCRRCFLPAQPLLSTLQRYNRRKCAHLLRDLAATADLPPNSALFTQQLLDLTHRWSEREDNDIDIGDVHPGCRSPIRFHTYPRPSAACSPTAALLARRQHHNAPLLYPAWTTQDVVTEEYRIMVSVNHELGAHTPAAWIQVFKQRLSLWCQQQFHLSQRRSFHWFLPTCLLGVLKILLTCTF